MFVLQSIKLNSTTFVLVCAHPSLQADGEEDDEDDDLEEEEGLHSLLSLHQLKERMDTLNICMMGSLVQGTHFPTHSEFGSGATHPGSFEHILACTRLHSIRFWSWSQVICERNVAELSAVALFDQVCSFQVKLKIRVDGLNFQINIKIRVDEDQHVGI